MYNQSRVSLQTIVYACIAAIALCLFIAFPIAYKASAETIIITPLSTTVKQKNNNKDQVYLISARLEDGTTEVFESTDTILFFKYNSADVFFLLENNKNKKFTVQVAGWRVPVLSMNRNIITATLKE